MSDGDSAVTRFLAAVPKAQLHANLLEANQTMQGKHSPSGAGEPQQLDIFADSRSVALRNDLIAAVGARDVLAARAAFDALRREFDDDAALGPAQRLIEHLQGDRGAAVSTFDERAVMAARQVLQAQNEPAAHALLPGGDARAWIAAEWRQLADRAAAQAPQAANSAHAAHFEPAAAAAHPAALYLRAAAWAQAAQAVERIASWRRIPQPLLWMVHARWRAQGADAAWPLLAEACWLASRQVPTLIAELEDRRLTALAARFESTFDGADIGWDALPAWALIEQPLLADVLSAAQAPADRACAEAFTTVLALLRLERQGRHHEIVAQRQRLRELSAPLFAQYMKTR